MMTLVYCHFAARSIDLDIEVRFILGGKSSKPPSGGRLLSFVRPRDGVGEQK